MEINIMINVIKDFGIKVLENEGMSPIVIFLLLMWGISMFLLGIRIEYCKKQKETIKNLTEVLDMYINQKKNDEEDKASE